MPIYFTDVAPTCPISTDSSPGINRALANQQRLFNRPIFTRPTVPPPRDFKSAVLAANLMRNIVQSAVFQKNLNNTKSNIKDDSGKGGKVTHAKDKFKNKKARWVEQKDKRVKRKYKYYAKLPDGSDDKTNFVVMERIERMVWYDKGWKSYLTFNYGDKGEGEPMGAPQGTSTAGGSGGDEGGDDFGAGPGSGEGGSDFGGGDA